MVLLKLDVSYHISKVLHVDPAGFPITPRLILILVMHEREPGDTCLEIVKGDSCTSVRVTAWVSNNDLEFCVLYSRT